MKVKELIEYLNTLDKEAKIFLQYDSYTWYDLEPECIQHVNEREITKYRDAKKLNVSINDYKIELG